MHMNRALGMEIRTPTPGAAIGVSPAVSRTEQNGKSFEDFPTLLGKTSIAPSADVPPVLPKEIQQNQTGSPLNFKPQVDLTKQPLIEGNEKNITAAEEPPIGWFGQLNLGPIFLENGSLGNAARDYIQGVVALPNKALPSTGGQVDLNISPAVLNSLPEASEKLAAPMQIAMENTIKQSVSVVGQSQAPVKNSIQPLVRSSDGQQLVANSSAPKPSADPIVFPKVQTAEISSSTNPTPDATSNNERVKQNSVQTIPVVQPSKVSKPVEQQSTVSKPVEQQSTVFNTVSESGKLRKLTTPQSPAGLIDPEPSKAQSQGYVSMESGTNRLTLKTTPNLTFNSATSTAVPVASVKFQAPMPGIGALPTHQGPLQPQTFNDVVSLGQPIGELQTVTSESFFSKILTSAPQSSATSVASNTAASILTQRAGKSMELQLVPRALGVVQVQLTNTKNGVSIEITTQTQKAETALKAELGVLNDLMKAGGLKLDEVIFKQDVQMEQKGQYGKQLDTVHSAGVDQSGSHSFQNGSRDSTDYSNNDDGSLTRIAADETEEDPYGRSGTAPAIDSSGVYL